MEDNELKFANDLNAFFVRFESIDNSHKCTELLRSVTPVGSNRITISENDVRRVLQCTNTRKATGPDECSHFLLKKCARKLAPV